MCLMLPARVVATDESGCHVKLGNRVDHVSMLLEPDLQVGDWVLVNAGTVVRWLEPDQAAEMRRAFSIVYGQEESAHGPEETVPGQEETPTPMTPTSVDAQGHTWAGERLSIMPGTG